MNVVIKMICSIGLRLSRPDILFWILPLMMILLIAGTVAQKSFGVLNSQQIYFSSFYYTIGLIPLPGGISLIGILFVSLLAKFLFKSEWSWRKSGTIISHFGVLILILGGIVTFATSKEGYLTIGEGQTSSAIEDYHERQIVIRAGATSVYEASFESLKPGTVIAPSSLGFQITIDKACYNCSISRRAPKDQDGWTVPGKFMQLNAKDNDPQDEMNLTGIEFHVSGTKNLSDNKYLTFDKFPKPPEIKIGPKSYVVTIERAKRPLPFSITLQSFKRDFYTGTDIAKSYQSYIQVNDNGQKWQALIQMNSPLRYRGFTLYQSSFDMSGEKPFTILAVVENKGRVFPYIATLIIAFGLILHLAIRLKRDRT